jgi:hypothetical protein
MSIEARTFTLLFKLPPDTRDMRSVMAALFDSECSDVVAGVGNVERGEMEMQFIREEGATLEASRQGAIDGVLKALPGAELLKVYQ